MPGPEEATLNNERSIFVQGLLDELSPDYRLAVVLRYWYDLSYAEIAEMLETTESAIKSRLFRARQALANQLESQSVQALFPAMEGS
jgi:RNA polymerase sigma-70 factor (ECF subfamily)